MEISEIIAKGNSYTKADVELLKVEVELFLNKTEASQSGIISQRSNLDFSPATPKKLFRNKERNEKIGKILQYLLTFLVKIPGTSESNNKPINPIEQFRELISYEVDLLLEEDVKKAVFNEINQMGSLNGDNVWDYQGRIIEKNRELNELIAIGASDVSSIFFTLCLVLEQLCLFWFDIKKEDVSRIRRRDIYIYKLAHILQGRYQQTEKS
jgi:hypothetical protein